MGLQEQSVAFKFAGGIETKMDEKAVPAVRLLGLENGVFHRASSIKKRNGYSLLSTAIDGSVERVTGARRMAARDDELLLFTRNRCYSRPSAGDQWVDAGALIAPLGRDRGVVHTSTAQTMPDRASHNGVTIYAWEDSRGGVWWTVVDANEHVFREPTQANAGGISPRCLIVGDNLIALYAVPAARQICALVINTATPTADVSEAIVITDLDTTSPVYDAVPTAREGSPGLVAWHEYDTNNIRVGYLTAGGVLGSPGNGHPSVARLTVGLVGPIACAYVLVDGGDDDRVMVGYVASDAAGYVHVLSGGDVMTPVGSTLSQENAVMASSDDIQRVGLVAFGTTAWAVFEENAVETSEHFCVVGSLTAINAGTGLGTVGDEHTILSLGLASRAFVIDEDAFAVFVHDTTFFNTYLTLRLSDFAPAGRHLPGSACGPTRKHVVAVAVEDDVATLVLPYKTRLQSVNNDKFTESALRVVTMDFDSEDTHQTAQFGRGLYMAAACPQHYAGRLWTEQGFHVGPELIGIASASGGALTTDGTYEYVAWYEWTDDLGEVHRGPTSVPQTIVLSGTAVTLTLPTLRVTRKENVRICVARSRAGDASEMFRVSSLDPTTADTANGYIANDPTVNSVSFTDHMSDADLAKEEGVYTVGGILSNDPSPLGSHVAVGKNRLFFTDAQAGNVVRFSKRIATGFGAECAPELMHDIDPLGGDVTALSVMDDVVYVFKASAVFAFNGDGPFEDGTTAQGGVLAGFSSSQLITSDVGCTDPGSIVLTPHGIMFKSAKGIRLLTRSREILPVGDPVEAYNAQAVRRATVMPDRTAVLFLTDAGVSLYYDYQFNQWSTFTNHEGLDAAVVDNTYHYLRHNDVVFRETPGEHRDGNTRITLALETAWLHLIDYLQGFQRFWKLLLLGTWVSPHQLAVSHRLDYGEAWTPAYYLDATGDSDEPGWITGDDANPIGEDPIVGTAYGDGDFGEGPYGGEAPDAYQWRYGIHESGQAIQFRFEDFEKAGLAGASFELTEMTIVGGIKKPDVRPFSGARST